MTVITLKEYAKNNHVSYEAVRQQVVRYKDELEGHIIKDGRQQLLDDEAVAFLDAKRQRNPVVVYQQSKDEELEALRAENKSLLIKVAELSDWKAKNAVLIAGAEQTQLALNASNKEKELLEGFLRDAKTELDAQQFESEAIQNALRADLSAEKEKADQLASELAETQKTASESLRAEAERADAAERRAISAEQEIQQLKNRSLWQRIWNKE